MVYMFYTRQGYFSTILSAVHCESSCLPEMHKLSRKQRRFTCFIVRSICSGVASKMTLKLFEHPKLIRAKLYGPGLMVPELHDMRPFCSFKAVAPA